MIETATAVPLRTHRARPVLFRDTGRYSTRNTSKGALIEEAGRVFSALAKGNGMDETRKAAVSGALLSQRSRANRERIWTLIQQRYLLSDWLTEQLIAERSDGAHNPEFIGLLYLLYALRDRLTFDFVTRVLPERGEGKLVTRGDVLDWLKQCAPAEPQIERWTESTRVKLAGSILTALRDFGVLTGKQKKRVARPLLPLGVAEALLRILIAEGYRGRDVVVDPTWRLFLRTSPEVVATLAALAADGRIRFEKVGATVVLETPAEWEEES
ncbi:MAG: DUF1819 family protein [Planctomycetes bacterium]|nr:DUF1819 family protein [Planctomycetota bacterium]